MWLILTFGFVISAIITHCIFAHLQRGRSLVFNFLYIASLIGALQFVLLVWLYDFSNKTIAGLLVYAAICELYIFLFTLAANGVSVSILNQLSKQKSSELDHVVNHLMVTRRIQQLKSGGFLIEQNGYLKLLPRGNKSVYLFEKFRTFFGHK